MKNIVIAIILSVSFIICAGILAKDRYKIIMNDGQIAGLITIKYDSVSGRTWRLDLPDNNWVEVVDSGLYYAVPDKNKNNKNK